MTIEEEIFIRKSIIKILEIMELLTNKMYVMDSRVKELELKGKAK